MRSNREISGNIVNDILGVGELYEQSTEKLFFSNGTQMKTKYELNSAMRSNREISGNIVNDILGVGELYEKSTEKQFSSNGTQMKIKYELNNAHVCHDNIYFNIPSIVKNITKNSWNSFH